MLGAALGVAQDEATIAQYCGITELGCTVQDLVIGAHAMGLQAEMLPVFSWPAAIETLVQHVPFVAMIDLANLYGITPTVSVAFCGTAHAPKRCGDVS
jgi:hypothetical protein